MKWGNWGGGLQKSREADHKNKTKRRWRIKNNVPEDLRGERFLGG